MKFFFLPCPDGVFHFAVEDFGDVFEGAGYGAKSGFRDSGGQEEFNQVVHGRHAHNAHLVIYNGHTAYAFGNHSLVDVEEGVGGSGSFDIASANGGGGWADVHEQEGWIQFAEAQEPFCSGIDLPTTGRHGVGTRGLLEKVSISNCGANCVGIWVSVADDVGHLGSCVSEDHGKLASRSCTTKEIRQVC